MMTPIILYDLIIGLSFGLQVFTSAYILTGGGRTAAGRRQLAADLRLLPLQAGLPVRPDGLCGRHVGRACSWSAWAWPSPCSAGRAAGCSTAARRPRWPPPKPSTARRSPTRRRSPTPPGAAALDSAGILTRSVLPRVVLIAARHPVHHPVLLDVRQRAEVQSGADDVPARAGPRRLGLAELHRRRQLHPVRAVRAQLVHHHGRHHDRLGPLEHASSPTGSRGSSGPAGT